MPPALDQPWISRPEEHFGETAPDQGLIVNDTGLPDGLVEGAVEDFFVEHSSMAWGRETNFQTYANEGSLLARRAFQTPANVIDEIRLARDLAERDDDIAGTLGQMVALAFGEGMENHHKDERTIALFNKIAKNADLDQAFQELYRELLITSQINSALLFTREKLEYTLGDADRILNASVAAPLLGVLPAENIRVLGNDMFRTGELAYVPDNDRLAKWLREFFDPETTAARKAEMGRQDRVSANLFVEEINLSAAEMMDPKELPCPGGKLYRLNPRMVKRTTFPKGSWKYPRPLLTRDFALLEAKRMLNIMDYALLQGGSSFVVVAKKGTDQHPARPGELTNLQRVVRKASKTGVIVGDHRLEFDIITPKLDELLNPQKRRMVGRKLSMAMLRLAEHGEEEGGAEGIKSDDEMVARVVMSDRHLVKRLVENHAYEETVSRNKDIFKKGAPSIWFPKIVLQGTQYFTDLILKLRDRGDIPRAWAVEAAGFPYDAAVEQRRREIERGDDEILIPGTVPHSSPDAGPQDNNSGRPSGSRDGQGQDPAAPKRTIGQNRGETIKAWWDDDAEMACRMGETTFAIIQQHESSAQIGRITRIEREMLETAEAEHRGATFYFPVNRGVETRNHKVVALTDGLRMVTGERARDGAVLAKVLCFREPEFDKTQAEDFALRWGFADEIAEEPEPPRATLPPPDDEPPWVPALASAAAASQHMPNINIEVQAQAGKVRKVVLRDDDGNIIGSEETPIEEQ